MIIPEFAIFYYAVNFVGGVVVSTNSNSKVAAILKENFPVFYNLRKSTNFGIVILNNKEDNQNKKNMDLKKLGFN